jgi:CheY-like chemotaxis protein
MINQTKMGYLLNVLFESNFFLMKDTKHKLLLADDDDDDCVIFREALKDLPIASSLTTVNDGVELMDLLTEKDYQLHDMLFLDINMPKKNGFECLLEIKQDDKLKDLPVIIFSTSSDTEMINMFYEKGAQYYIRKPGDFSKLRSTIYKAIEYVSNNDNQTPLKENFVINII